MRWIFDSFVNDLKSEARDLGYSNRQVTDFFSGVAQDPKVIKADRSQGVFQLPFLEFSGRLISKHRRDHGAKNLKKYKAVFDRIERDFGISRGVLTAFWAFETDFGAFQGDFNTLNALVTLSHDCRRPELFRPQVFAAHETFTRGDFDPVQQRALGLVKSGWFKCCLVTLSKAELMATGMVRST